MTFFEKSLLPITVAGMAKGTISSGSFLLTGTATVNKTLTASVSLNPTGLS